MERQYSHLTWKNRLKIRRMLDERRKPKEIADALHVHTSTIYREGALFPGGGTSQDQGRRPDLLCGDQRMDALQLH